MTRRSLAALAVSGSLAGLAGTTTLAATAEDVVRQYADLAHAKYEDSLVSARLLQRAVGDLLDNPNARTLSAARAAWLAARIPYQQTEVYRFGNASVDEWEGKVNAWPLDEGLIDYVATDLYGEDSEENRFYTVNVIANAELTAGGKVIDATVIDVALLQSLHEIDDVEANVATGYHAIEFLLWGQDRNGTGPGAGSRPWTDFATGSACTGGNCDRRRAYLRVATDLMISDLEEMVEQWSESGATRKGLVGGDPNVGLRTMLTGMGSLSYGELAGERMKLGLMLHDPEEEHDCFSDNTHNSHYYDALGIANAYLGRYRRIDGSMVSGASLSALVEARDAGLDAEMRARLGDTLAAMDVLRRSAEEDGVAYDQLIAEGNAEGNAKVQAAIDALVAQTRSIERVIAKLELGALELEGSDSLDNPEAVFK